MGPKCVDYKMTPDAVRKREEREVAPAAFAEIKSQLQLARKRARKGVENPAKQVVLDKLKARNCRQDRPFCQGDHVFFVRPGPERCAVPGRGEILCFPDKKKEFFAIDRSRALQKPRVLALIDIVPGELVFHPPPCLRWH